MHGSRVELHRNRRKPGALVPWSADAGRAPDAYRHRLGVSVAGTPDPNPSLSAVEPVSVGVANSLREKLGEARDWAAIFADTVYFARPRLGSLAFPSPKPREVKDISGCAGKPDLRRTAWWARQDSNLRPSNYFPKIMVFSQVIPLRSKTLINKYYKRNRYSYCTSSLNCDY
jgi:hypothetical protein